MSFYIYIIIVLRTVENVEPGVRRVHLEAERTVFSGDIGNGIIPSLEDDPAREG